MPRAEIFNGPSKWDLMLALFDHRLPEIGNRPIDFRVGESSGNSLYAAAFLSGCSIAPGPEVWELTGEIRFPRTGCWVKFKAMYSTAQRKGHMDYEP